MRKEIKCPICGGYVYKEKYDICPYCHWEYDPSELKDREFGGGANGISVNSAKYYFDLGYKLAKKEHENEE